jgi:diketogulonate reductase-like aldo/keto reductase
VNRPFQRGDLFSRVKGRPLPDWANEIDAHSWAQYFLKFIIANPTVTCAIPATKRVDYMIDNMGAQYGRLPDEKMREEMVRYLFG